ncbi:hypothetical protein C8Q76DRAFT_608423 [Earliella scabrosa]|nr:hypothetical protein C8Q76DRAFT_608423 [Earliella scabrosa]
MWKQDIAQLSLSTTLLLTPIIENDRLLQPRWRPRFSAVQSVRHPVFRVNTPKLTSGYPSMTTNYCIMASSAVLWFDTGLTLTDEVERVWRRPGLSWVTIAYLAMRYSAVMARVVFVLEFLLSSMDDRCSVLTHLNDVLYILNTLTTATVIIIRVYGISASNWKYLLLVVPLSLVRPILYGIETARYKTTQAGRPFGCVYHYTLSDVVLKQFSTIASVTMLASHAILIIVTAIKARYMARLASESHMRLPLVKLLVRDSKTAAVLVPFSLYANPAPLLGVNATIWLVWPYFYEVMNVIIVSRFMLDIRGLYPSTQTDAVATTTMARSHVSSIVFNNRLESGIQVDAPPSLSQRIGKNSSRHDRPCLAEHNRTLS